MSLKSPLGVLQIQISGGAGDKYSSFQGATPPAKADVSAKRWHFLVIAVAKSLFLKAREMRPFGRFTFGRLVGSSASSAHTSGPFSSIAARRDQNQRVHAQSNSRRSGTQFSRTPDASAGFFWKEEAGAPLERIAFELRLRCPSHQGNQP